MEDDNTCNGDGGGNGFGVEDSQWTLQAVDNQDSNNTRNGNARIRKVIPDAMAISKMECPVFITAAPFFFRPVQRL